MKEQLASVLQSVGRSVMLPAAVLPMAGLLLGIGASLTNETTIQTYGLEAVAGPGTMLNVLLSVMRDAGNVIFRNLPLIFAVSIAAGMAKGEKGAAALTAMISFFVMHASAGTMLRLTGSVLSDGAAADMCGIMSLQGGVFSGMIVGVGAAGLHNRYHNIVLPPAVSFFSGSRFVLILSAAVYLFAGMAMYFLWTAVQNGIFALAGLAADTGCAGALIFGIMKQALMPFGLHHVLYLPFWHTGVGGNLVQGGQNIVSAQLASSGVTPFSADAARYFSGEFIFTIFGLPGAALAMYQRAKPEKKKMAGGLLLSAAFTSMLTGLTEPIEFSFLFAAPWLFFVHVLLGGAAYMTAYVLHIDVGPAFSGGFLNLLFFGILPGEEETNWMYIIPAGIVYFFLYYGIFSYLIKKFDFKTPGREDDEEETALFTKADGAGGNAAQKANRISVSSNKPIHTIALALGCKKNITSLDCCAERLRCSVADASLVSDALLKASGAAGVIKKGTDVQIVYGPQAAAIKAGLERYLKSAPDAGSADEDAVSPPSAEGSFPAGLSPEPKKAPAGKTYFRSPFSGELHPITEAPDGAFAGKMTGDGFFVYPTENTVYAPADGEVTFVFDTKHAIGMITSDGLEYLIHIGIDTVKLGGRGFTVFVENGQTVKQGDKILEFDGAFIRQNAPSDACLCVFTDLEKDKEVHTLTNGTINALDEAVWF